MNETGTTRILMVDDHQLFVDAMCALLRPQPGLKVVGVAPDARRALTLVGDVDHDLLIADITLPDTNGLALVRNLRQMDYQRPVLMLTMHGEADLVLEALHAGAQGYALKRERFETLVEAVRTTAQRRRFLSPLVRPLLSDGEVLPSAASGPMAGLSAREREIFQLMLRGHNNRDIGRTLSISVKTVETHRGHIFRKLAVHSIGDLLRLAARHGMLPSC